jgi:spermidine/putrescine transport system substrate-binding protein
MTESRLNRRELIRVGAGFTLAAYGLGGLAGCTVERPIDKSAAAEVVTPGIDGDLHIYNWAQYMDPSLKKTFADRYGISVFESNFDNLEAMLTKIRGGAAYDVIFPSGEYVARMRQEALLRPFDRGRLRNIDNVAHYYDSPWYDPHAEFTVPYAYYTTGICWRSDRVSGMTGSWNDMMNPEAAGKMFILDDFEEAIGEANMINGFPINTADSGQLEQSKQTLLQQKQNARGFSTNSVQNLVSGQAVLHQAWNGDVVNVRNQVDNPEVYRYETCKEGVPVATDSMCIPVNARSPGTAMLFMDWILNPDNAYKNVMWNGYPMPCEGGRQAFEKLVKSEPSIDVNLDDLQNGLEYNLGTTENRQQWSKVFTEVKAG